MLTAHAFCRCGIYRAGIVPSPVGVSRPFPWLRSDRRPSQRPSQAADDRLRHCFIRNPCVEHHIPYGACKINRRKVESMNFRHGWRLHQHQHALLSLPSPLKFRRCTHGTNVAPRGFPRDCGSSGCCRSCLRLSSICRGWWSVTCHDVEPSR